jgi:hypothetical protein
VFHRHEMTHWQDEGLTIQLGGVVLGPLVVRMGHCRCGKPVSAMETLDGRWGRGVEDYPWRGFFRKILQLRAQPPTGNGSGSTCVTTVGESGDGSERAPNGADREKYNAYQRGYKRKKRAEGK